MEALMIAHLVEAATIISGCAALIYIVQTMRGK
jgi:hypothetical protein